MGLSSIALAGGQNEQKNDQSDPGTQNFYVGALIGGNRNSNSDGAISDTTTNPAIGVTAGIRVSPRFGVGFFGSRYGQTSSGIFLGLPAGTSTTTTMLLAQGNYFSKAIHLGVEAGATTSSWDRIVASRHDGSSSTSMVYGPHGGIDLKLDKAITLGGEFHYLFSTAHNVASNAQALAALKIWI